MRMLGSRHTKKRLMAGLSKHWQPPKSPTDRAKP
jgi:hypothetical protein